MIPWGAVHGGGGGGGRLPGRGCTPIALELFCVLVSCVVPVFVQSVHAMLAVHCVAWHSAWRQEDIAIHPQQWLDLL